MAPSALITDSQALTSKGAHSFFRKTTMTLISAISGFDQQVLRALHGTGFDLVMADPGIALICTSTWCAQYYTEHMKSLLSEPVLDESVTEGKPRDPIGNHAYNSDAFYPI